MTSKRYDIDTSSAQRSIDGLVKKFTQYKRSLEEANRLQKVITQANTAQVNEFSRVAQSVDRSSSALQGLKSSLGGIANSSSSYKEFNAILRDTQGAASGAAASLRDLNTARTAGAGRFDITGPGENLFDPRQRTSQLEFADGQRIARDLQLISRGYESINRKQQAVANSTRLSNTRFNAMNRLFAESAPQQNNFAKQTELAGRNMLLTSNRAGLLTRSLIRLRSIVGTFAGYGSLFLIVRELQQSVGAAREYSKVISEIRTISDRTALSTGQWRSELTELSNAFGFTFVETAEANYQALSNQVVNAADSFAFLQSQARLALTTVSSLDASVSASTAIINAYGETNAASSRISSVLFKTVEEGRIRLEELGDTIGRVSILSSQLGISFVEQQAALTQLTKLGVRAEEAMTLLRNVELKLIKPSERMSELFNEWGFASGQAAVQTLGLAGVLQKFLTEAQTSGDVVAELGDIFTRLRAIVGITGLTQASLTEEIEKFNNSSEQAFGAFQERIDDLSTKANKQIQQFRNTFVNEFGTPVLKQLVEFVEGLGGAEAATIEFLSTGRDLVIVGTKVAVTYAALTQVVKLATGTFAAYKLILQGVKTAEEATLLFSAKGKLLLTAVTAAVGTYIFVMNKLKNEVKDTELAMKALQARFREDFSKVTILALERINSQLDDSYNQAESRITQFNRAYLQNLANLRARNTEFTVSLKNDLEAVNTALEASTKKAVASVSKTIGDLDRQIGEYQSKIDQGIDRLFGEETTLEIDIKLRQINAKSKQDAVNELTTLQQELNDRARIALVQSQDPRQADVLFRQSDRALDDLKAKLLDIEPVDTDFIKRQAELFFPEATTPRQRRFQRDTVNAEIERQEQERQQQVNQALLRFEKLREESAQARIDAQKEYLDLLKQEKATQEANLKQQEARFEKAQDIIKQLDSFDPNTQDLDQFEALRKQFETVSRGTFDNNDRFQLIRELAQKEEVLRKQLVAQETKEKLDAAKRLQEQAQKAQTDLLKTREAKEKELATALTTELQKGIEQGLVRRVAQLQAARSANARKNNVNVLSGIFGGDGQASKEFKQFTIQIKEAQDRVSEFREAFGKLGRTEAGESFDKQVNALVDKLKEFPELTDSRFRLEGLIEDTNAVRKNFFEVEEILTDFKFDLDTTDANISLDELKAKAEALRQQGIDINFRSNEANQNNPVGGNEVSVNFGDVNITGTPEESSRQIIDTVRNAIRTGELQV